MLDEVRLACLATDAGREPLVEEVAELHVDRRIEVRRQEPVGRVGVGRRRSSGCENVRRRLERLADVLVAGEHPVALPVGVPVEGMGLAELVDDPPVLDRGRLHVELGLEHRVLRSSTVARLYPHRDRRAGRRVDVSREPPDQLDLRLFLIDEYAAYWLTGRVRIV